MSKEYVDKEDFYMVIDGCGCQPSQYKEECYFYSEEHDMGASIPCCSFHGGLGNCPCENCKSYLSEQAAYRIVRAVREGKYKPVVRCKDCVYWKDRYIKLNDGTERQYSDADGDYVDMTVGVNIEAMCHYEDGRGWKNDKSVFRSAEDYCSRGVAKKRIFRPNCGAFMRKED